MSPVTVCGIESWFVHVTVVPSLTVREFGLKAKFDIVAGAVIDAETGADAGCINPFEEPAGAAAGCSATGVAVVEAGALGEDAYHQIPPMIRRARMIQPIVDDFMRMI